MSSTGMEKSTPPEKDEGKQGIAKPRMVTSSITVSGAGGPMQGMILDIVTFARNGIEKELANPDKERIAAWGQILNAAATLEKSLPVTQRLSFGLTKQELYVLIVYGLGAAILVIGLPFLTPWASWKGSDLANIFLYWSGVIAVLLGAQALPQLTGKSGGSSSSSGGAGGGGDK